MNKIKFKNNYFKTFTGIKVFFRFSDINEILGEGVFGLFETSSQIQSKLK